MLKERDSIRSKAFLKAVIRFQNRNVTMDCIVRNISLSGARIEVGQAFALPTEFELEIPQRGAVFQCALKWRRDDAAGVKFMDSVAHATTAPPHSGASMEELQHENARLRQEIAKLKARLQELVG
ncbi:PilZ domain-containing protein [Rhizobiales bacterium GAS191]|nr:PilZ domain-containing protein [Rhizobiales bacterium GAS191]